MLLHGIDLASLDRIEAVYKRYQAAFLKRILTPSEQELMGPVEEELTERQLSWLTGRFAAKEAVLKALGTGLTRGTTWQDIEVLRHETGAPHVSLGGQAFELYEAKKGRDIQLSITHDANIALASCIILCDE